MFALHRWDRPAPRVLRKCTISVGGSPLIILGINAYHGDSSACLVVDGQLIVAIEEERLRRVKHWAGFPSESVRLCLDYVGANIQDVDHIAVGRNPSAHLAQKALFALKNRTSVATIRDRLANRQKIQSIPASIADSLDVDPKMVRAQFHNIEHHLAHMASSFFLSPFESAACLSVDGFGDFASGMLGTGQGNHLRKNDWIQFPHSLGVFYTACTQYIGFDKYGDEYKVMGLAPYGEPEYLEDFRKIIRTTNNGKYELDLSYFIHHSTGVKMEWNGGPPEIGPVFSNKWVKQFGPARRKGESLDDRHRNLASSLQARCEEVYFHLLAKLAEGNNQQNLCIAGGVSFNSSANGKVFEKTPFSNLHIHPAAGDAGTAVGAAFSVWHQELGHPRSFELRHAYWGPGFSQEETKTAVERAGLAYQWISDDETLVRKTADRIASGDVVGWYQGRSEWGPRALGNRSIVVDPRRPDMKDTLNERIKRREPFRPFAPSILEERTGDYFEETRPVPFMQQVYKIKPERRAELPAVTHVDGTGRLQTVSKGANPLYHRLIEVFGELTGTPVLLNTSLNENEPIVNTPDEAVATYARTRMDTLVIGNAFITRNAPSQ